MERAKSFQRQKAFAYDEEDSMEFGEDPKESHVPVKILDSEIQNKQDDDEETAFDRDFIKVEKEIDIKDRSQVQETMSMEEQQSSSELPSSNFEIEDAQVKIKELEIRCEVVLKDLHSSESEKSQLLSQLASATEKINQSENHSQQLELELEKIRNEAESNHNLQVQSLEKAQADNKEMQSELLDLKKAFDETLTELVTSRMKTEELELNLSSSISKAKKYEELCKEKDANIEIQTNKASTYEKLVEDATLKAKEMEDKIASFQEELEVLNTKSAHDLQIKEEHSSALLKVQEDLVISTSKVKELEQSVNSKESIIKKLSEDLNYYKDSEEHAKNDLITLENLLAASKQELQAKISSLQDIESKYEREVKINEGIESTLGNQHKQVKNLQEKLVKVTEEKEDLEAVSADLNNRLIKEKETCEILENKLSESDQNFSKADSLLTQARSYNTEMEQKLKDLEELHTKSCMEAETATQRKLELEDLLQMSNVGKEELKAILRENEIKLVSSEQRNVELEKQLNLLQLKCNDMDQELDELREKSFELTCLLKNSEEENALSGVHLQESEDKVNQLEHSLNNSSEKILRLEQELKGLEEKCTEHENQTTISHQRSVELEDLIQKSHLKSTDAESKVAELEILLEDAKRQVQELEEQLRIGFIKNRETEKELVQFQEKVSELKAVEEAFQVRTESLKSALKAASDKEKDLTYQLNCIMEEKNKFEQSTWSSEQQYLEAENLIKVLQSDLKLSNKKLEDVEQDLLASNIREQELLDKLKYNEELLEHEREELKIFSARDLELETSHKNLVDELELKLQETLVSLSQKDSEAEQLNWKILSVENQAAFYQTQEAEATERTAFYKSQADEAKEIANVLKAELEISSAAQRVLEETITELKIKMQEAEMEVEQASSECEMISNTNAKLKEELVAHEANINKLQEIVNNVTAEKDKAVDQLVCQAKSLSEITEKHSRGLDLQLETDSLAKKTNEKLIVASEQLKIRDSEAKKLNEKLLLLESQLAIYEKQASEATTSAENKKLELDEALLEIKKLEEMVKKIQEKASQFEDENESLASTNLKLTQSLASYETRLNELEKSLDAVLLEKNEVLGQLNMSRKTDEEHVSEIENLRSQLSSFMEEKVLLSEMHQNAKEELERTINGLEEKLEEKRLKVSSLSSHMEDLKSDLMAKSDMQLRATELEQQLVLMDIKFKEELNRLKLEATEKELLLSSKLEEAASKLKDGDNVKEQERALAAERQHDVEVKSRDFSLGMTKPERRKSKKKNTSDSNQPSESSATTIQEHSLGTTFKFILGIALVSMAIGIILGKRY